ncbi:MAG: caspase family protein [Aristaeellaceae bacterium]
MRGKAMLALLAAAWLWLWCAPALAQGVNRALLVGCDDFITQPSTAPASANNVALMAQALSGGAMNLENLVARRGDVSSIAELEQLIRTAFDGASQADVNYFYISTHGLWEQGMSAGDMTLLLSDGNREEGVTAQQLRDIFDTIPGVKVLILDACHTGAVIGKGVHAPYDNVFEGDEYKVLCSSGGAEESWFWQGEEDDEALVGAGYFSTAVANGLSVAGGYSADDNRDGNITLTELKRYLLANHGASTVRTYPEEDDFVILRYDAQSYTGRRRDSVMENVTFEGEVLSILDPTVAFSFNMVKPAQVAYQIVYQRDGRWDFDSSRLIYDNEERYGAYGDAQGYLSPGMKQRTLTLSLSAQDSYGYVLVQLITRSGGIPSLSSSRMLCVPPQQGDPLLDILTDSMFCPGVGEEMTFVVTHRYPCELTVTIQSLEGKTVRRLASRTSSRPEQLSPAGSTFCWNGQDSRGNAAPAGQYRVHVKAYVGEGVYEALSEPFELVQDEG